MSATSDEVNDNNHKNNDFHDFIKRLPKVELHAHLNGCIRETTLFELAKDRGVTLGEHHFAEEPIADDHSMYNVRPRSLQDCFDMFAEIPKCVDDLAALARIATEALEDFSLHHVVYLELRSTPKQLLVKSGGTEIADKQQYCLSIINSMKDFERRDEERYNQEQANGVPSPRLPMICRFLVAVDRSQSVEDALEHVQLAEILKNEHNEIIVGVDLGGNPTKNHFNDFREAFERARASGLKVTLHCAEVPCDDNNPATKTSYEEAKTILEFCPDRLGHALLLPPTLQQILFAAKIPVESCPTSNVMTLELAKHCSGSLLEGLKQHPQLDNWLQTKHPISIGTDDPGVFHTNATKELMLLQKAFNVDKDGLERIVIQSMDHAFCDSETKKLVQRRIKDRLC